MNAEGVGGLQYIRMYKHRDRPKPQSPNGLPPEAIPAWAHYTSRAYLQSRGLTQAEVERYSLQYCSGGEWKRRIIIPIYDRHGGLLAFQGRHIDDQEPRYRTEGPRPLYAPWLGETIHTKANRLLIVEGPFDLYSVLRLTPAVATLGNEPAPTQIDQIVAIAKEYGLKLISIWYDQGADRQAFSLQLKLNPRIFTSIIFSDKHKDPGSTTLEDMEALL